MKLAATAVGLCLTASFLAGCGGSDSSESGGGDGGDGGGDESTYVDGATFSMALSSDPGNLDPQMGAGSALFTMSQLAYDALVSVNAESGGSSSAALMVKLTSSSKINLAHSGVEQSYDCPANE